MIGRAKYIAIAFTTLLLSACSSSSSTDAVRPCLSNAAGCGTTDSQVESSFSDSSSTGTSSGFTCSVVSDPVEVLPYQPVRIQITTAGGSGAKKVVGYSQSFSSSISLYGSYNADKVGTVVSRTVTVTDANNVSTSCVANVKVSNSIGSSGVGCTVALKQSSLKPGDTANFVFTATGITGRATFTKFYPTANWLVADRFLRRPTDLTAEADVRYDYEGAKVASIQVADSSGQQAFCSLPFSVGNTQQLNVTASPGFTTNISGFIDLTANAAVVNASNVVYTYSLAVPDANVVLISTGSNTARIASTKGSAHVVAVNVTAVGTNVNLSRVIQLNYQAGSTGAGALTACNVLSAPLGYAAELSAPSVQGSVTRVRAFPNGGVGPFEVELLGIYEGANGFPFQVLSDVPRPHNRQLNLRLSRAGNPEIRVRVRDTSSGAMATCSTFHISKKSDVFVVSADADAYGTTGPLVKVFKGASSPVLMENFHAFASDYRGGTRVATADFDGDGINDFLVGRGYGAASGYSGAANRPGFKIYKGTDTTFYPGKPAPQIMWEVAAAFDQAAPDRLYIGAGDVNADGRADAIIGAGCNAAQGRVRIFSGQGGVMIADFIAHDASEGVRVSGGDVNGDGYTDVITTTCTGTNVRVYSGKSIKENYPLAMTQRPVQLYAFTPYPGLSLNVRAGSGDVDRDGYADVITSSNGSTAPYVKIYSGRTGQLLVSLNAMPSSNGLMNVSAGDMNGDGYADVLVGGAYNTYPRLRAFDGAQLTSFGPGAVLTDTNVSFADFSPISDFRGTIYVGGGTGGL